MSAQIKFVQNDGSTLNVQEKQDIELALNQLQIDMQCEELLLWGKIDGKLKVCHLCVLCRPGK